MKLFMDEEFLLSTETAKKLYHEYCGENANSGLPLPHRSAERSMRTGKFDNITQVWLGGDHYKWRQMRSNGVEENYITGDASDREKFQKWAETPGNGHRQSARTTGAIWS